GESLTSRAEVQQLERSLREADISLSRSHEDLEQLRAAGSSNVATVADEQKQLAAFSATIREQTETIQRDRELLSRDKDIRDLLAQIDQVFVTVEPPGGSRQPTGKQLLTAAFLNQEPNHP